LRKEKTFVIRGKNNKESPPEEDQSQAANLFSGEQGAHLELSTNDTSGANGKAADQELGACRTRMIGGIVVTPIEKGLDVRRLVKQSLSQKRNECFEWNAFQFHTIFKILIIKIFERK
jgi:hypothetical protein